MTLNAGSEEIRCGLKIGNGLKLEHALGLPLKRVQLLPKNR